MDSINVYYLKKIVREDGTSYVSVEKYESIRNWNLEVVNSSSNSIDLIIIVGQIHEDLSTENNFLKIFSPKLMYELPGSKDKDEWPIVYREESDYFPLYLLSRLIDQTAFRNLIEMGAKLSKHSTKLITFLSLENSLKKVFGSPQPVETWTVLSQKLIDYINKLIEYYPFLGYLPVQERLSHREHYVSDLSFAWELYFRFFLENWILIEGNVIPDLHKNYEINGWRGNFFSRSNPFWKEILGERLRFKLNNQQKETVYKSWIKWLEEPK